MQHEPVGMMFAFERGHAEMSEQAFHRDAVRLGNAQHPGAEQFAWLGRRDEWQATRLTNGRSHRLQARLGRDRLQQFRCDALLAGADRRFGRP